MACRNEYSNDNNDDAQDDVSTRRESRLAMGGSPPAVFDSHYNYSDDDKMAKMGDKTIEQLGMTMAPSFARTNSCMLLVC